MVSYEKTIATGKLSQYTLYFVFTCLYLKNELADGDKDFFFFFVK